MSDERTEERVLHVPLERVFRAFVDPELLALWLGVDAFVELRVGGAYELRTPDNADGTPDVNGVVVEVVAPECLVVGWAGASEGRMRLELEPTLGGTRVKLALAEHPAWGEDPLGRLQAWFAGPKP